MKLVKSKLKKIKINIKNYKNKIKIINYIKFNSFVRFLLINKKMILYQLFILLLIIFIYFKLFK